MTGGIQGWYLRHIGIMFVLVGLGVIVAALVLAYDTQRKIENWVEIEGTVVDAEVVKGSSGGTYGGSSYHVEVTFEYEFDGTTYRSTISPGGSESGIGAEAAKTKEAKSYTIGSTRMLSVNPSNPKQISLLLGYDLRSFILSFGLGVAGLLSVLVGLLIRKFLPRFIEPSPQ